MLKGETAAIERGESVWLDGQRKSVRVTKRRQSTENLNSESLMVLTGRERRDGFRLRDP